MLDTILKALTPTLLNKTLRNFGTSYSEFVEFLKEIRTAVKKINEQ